MGSNSSTDPKPSCCPKKQTGYPTQPTNGAYGPSAPPPPYNPVAPTYNNAGAPPAANPMYATGAPAVTLPQYQPGYEERRSMMQYQVNGPPPMTADPNAPPPYARTQQTVVTNDAFDAGARFHNGQRNIPPPPPGYMPNQAQMAAANGHNVVVGQRPQTMMGGTGTAGAVMW